MLTHLAVKGFQSLADVELELAPFTVIVGASNSGKSALRRALEGMVTNASATGKLRTGADLITVAVALDDGSAVVWEKGAKRNAYAIRTPDGAELVQDKPGSNATPEVTALLGLDDLNFVDQFQPPFLLTQTPANAAKALGALTNVTVLYDGIREATSRQRTHGQTATVLEGQLATATDELATYAWLPAESEALTVAAAALAAAKEAGATYAQLHADWGTAEQLAADVANADAVLASSLDIEAITELLGNAANAAAAAWDLAADLERARQLSYEAVHTPLPAVWDVEPVVAVTTIANQLQNDLINARSLVATIEAQGQEIANADAERQAAHAQLDAIDICPLCEQPAHLGIT